MRRNNRLIVFDVEGVLLPKRRFLLFEVAGRLGFLTYLKFLIVGILYEIGILSTESALKSLYGLLKGISYDKLFNLYRRLPTMPNAEELLAKLKELGFKIALISSGIPRVFVEDLARRLNADYAYGLEVGLANGYLTGEIWGDVIQKDGKATALKEILSRTGLSLRDSVVIADDRNNLPLLRLCKLSIGFNPDFILTVKSDFVVKGDLLEILPILMQEAKINVHALFNSSVLRELIHISGILIPFVCIYLTDIHIVISAILLVASLYIISEFLRIFGKNFPLISTITLKSADKSELQEFATAPVLYAFGIALSLLLFPPPIGYASIAVLTFGDGFASIFGKRFGRTVFPLNKGKKIEGSLFGWLFAILGSLLFVNPIKALIGATVGLLAECLPSPVNDNLVIPLASGLALTLI